MIFAGRIETTPLQGTNRIEVTSWSRYGGQTPPTRPTENWNMENILEVQDIHTFIGQYHILQGVNVTVPKGSITALLGRNGAGKTTTLKSIIGLLTPRQGKVILDGREVQGM